MKVFYKVRIFDDMYAIYKISNYGNYALKLVNAGIAYTNGGDYTDKFIKLMKKYDINDDYADFSLTSSTLEEYKISLFLMCFNKQLELPSKCYALCEDAYKRSNK